jgi:hypothetical protein
VGKKAESEGHWDFLAVYQRESKAEIPFTGIMLRHFRKTEY